MRVDRDRRIILEGLHPLSRNRAPVGAHARSWAGAQKTHVDRLLSPPLPFARLVAVPAGAPSCSVAGAPAATSRRRRLRRWCRHRAEHRRSALTARTLCSARTSRRSRSTSARRCSLSRVLARLPEPHHAAPSSTCGKRTATGTDNDGSSSRRRDAPPRQTFQTDGKGVLGAQRGAESLPERQPLPAVARP